MPAKNRVKTYFPNGFYHIYNRGVEKRDIFLEERDYVYFLYLLKKYLSPPPKKDRPGEITKLISKDLNDEIEFLCYCLMPNHIHLLLQQRKIDSMTKFLRRVCTSYAIFFNKKYERVGPLFQGTYKAVTVDNESYLLHLSRYIHQNPLEIRSDLKSYKWSSYLDYLGERHTSWVKKGMILHYFKTERDHDALLRQVNTYQGFVEETDFGPLPLLRDISLDS